MFNEKKQSAFTLPRMKITPIWEHQLGDSLNELREAQMQLSIFQDKKGDLKIIHTELNEELYALTLAALHRNTEVHDFIKLSLINIEQFREGKLKEANELMTQAVEYIRIRNAKNLYL